MKYINIKTSPPPPPSIDEKLHHLYVVITIFYVYRVDIESLLTSLCVFYILNSLSENSDFITDGNDDIIEYNYNNGDYDW